MALDPERFVYSDPYEDPYGVDEHSRCPACGDPIDYCQGHGVLGDPAGFVILLQHDNDNHDDCHDAGCDEARAMGASA